MSKDVKSKFMQLVHEAKLRPALVEAKVSLESDLNEPSFYRICQHAADVLAILAELDDPNVSFKDVYTILSCMKPNNVHYSGIQTSLYLYKLRTGIITDEELEEPLNETLENGPRELVSRSVANFYFQQHMDAYEYLTEAIIKDVHVTRSILCAFGKPLLETFRHDLSEAREKNVVPCSCNSAGVFNYGYRSSMVQTVKSGFIETSFITDLKDMLNSKENLAKNSSTQIFNSLQLCKFHRMISELDDVIRMLEMVDCWDHTAILNEHVKAKRIELAAKYIQLNSKYISKRELDAFEKMILKEREYLKSKEEDSLIG